MSRLALGTSVVVDLVLLLELVLPNRTHVKQMSRHLLALIHDVLRVQATDESERFIVVA